MRHWVQVTFAVDEDDQDDARVAAEEARELLRRNSHRLGFYDVEVDDVWTEENPDPRWVRP